MYKQGEGASNIFLIIAVIFSVYFIWRATGGVERGEERRAAGENGIFIEVKNVPEEFGNQAIFGTVEKDELLEEFTQE